MRSESANLCEVFRPERVAPQDRKRYLDALETGPLAGDLGPFQTFMHERLSATLDEYLQALGEARPEGG